MATTIHPMARKSQTAPRTKACFGVLAVCHHGFLAGFIWKIFALITGPRLTGLLVLAGWALLFVGTAWALIVRRDT